MAQRNMQKTSYMAFYPSRPFFAVSKVDFNAPCVGDWFYKQMAEEVFAVDDERASLRICRDGRILIRIERLEASRETIDFTANDDAARLWGKYLDYLNTFYLLLDSAAIEVAHLGYFNLHEITNRDAIRLIYKPGEFSGESIQFESIVSVFQLERFARSYTSADAIELDQRISRRRVIPAEVITHASNIFFQIAEKPGAEKQFASFAKSLSEYKIGNYEIAIVLAWFITEAAIGSLWRSHLEALNQAIDDDKTRINKDRKGFLTGRDFSISIISNMLELAGVIDLPLFKDIDKVRKYRNDIVHASKFALGAIEAQLAIKTAQAMIERQWGIKLSPNMTYSVSGL